MRKISVLMSERLCVWETAIFSHTNQVAKGSIYAKYPTPGLTHAHLARSCSFWHMFSFPPFHCFILTADAPTW